MYRICMTAVSIVRHTIVVVVACVAAASLIHAQARPSSPGAPTAQVRDPTGRVQALPTGTATISGTVAASGQPAIGARVTLRAQNVPFSRNATVDNGGRFEFTALPAGRYTVSVSKPGHVSVTYGQRRLRGPGSTIALADGESRSIAVQLPRGGVITGMVLDDRGEPAINTHVRAMRFVTTNGQRRLQQSSADSTDDRGIYRIHSLDPGDYVVCANSRGMGAMSDTQRTYMEIEGMRRSLDNVNGPNAAAARTQIAARLAELEARLQGDDQPTGYAAVCYPGTSPAGPTTTVPVGSGEERTGIDLQLHLTPVARIEGFVVLPQAAAGGTTGDPQRVQITMVNTDAVSTSIDTHGARADHSGRFSFFNVAPGSYRIVARTMPMSPPRRGADGPDPRQDTRLWAMVEFAVAGQDITNLALDLQPGMSVSGHVVFQGTRQTPPSDLSSLRVSVEPVMTYASGPQLASRTQGTVDSTGRFRIDNVMPGEYRVAAFAAGQGWSMESVTVSGRDVLDESLEIRPGRNVTGAVIAFTDQITELTGTVVDEKGQPAADYTVLLFAADPRYWTPGSRRIRPARTQPDGTFSFRGVPPGDYRMAAFLDAEPGAWRDAAFLEQLTASSVRISLAPDEKKVQHLRVAN